MLVTPSAPGQAPAGLDWTGDPAFNFIWTSLHVPCVTVPAGDRAERAAAGHPDRRAAGGRPGGAGLGAVGGGGDRVSAGQRRLRTFQP